MLDAVVQAPSVGIQGKNVVRLGIFGGPNRIKVDLVTVN